MQHLFRGKPLPPDAVVFVLGDPTFGLSGFSNLQGETVLLVDAQGDTVDSHTYTIGNREGVSEERVSDDSEWEDGRWEGGTPGRTNSVSPKTRDVAIEPASFELPFGGRSVVSLRVVNHGTMVARAHVHLVGADSAAGDSIFSVEAGASVWVEVTIESSPGVRETYVAEVVAPGDEDPTNDRATVEIVFGVPSGSVVVTELMVAPTEGTEWVEVQNRASFEVDLAGWGLRDRSGRVGRVQPAEPVAPGGRRILARVPLAGSPTSVVSPWPALNDGGDTLTLLDATDSEVDDVTYDSSRPGRSIERIDVSVEGGPDNWLVSTASGGSTPGQPNSVAYDATAQLRIDATPSPFADTTEITVTVDSRHARLMLRVFDRLGRLRRTLASGEQVGSRFVTVWDGRDDRGVRVKPGPFVIDVEAVAENGRILRARNTVIYGRGLQFGP